MMPILSIGDPAKGQASGPFPNLLLGAPFAAEKKQATSGHGVFLGLQHSLADCLHSGQVHFWLKANLEAKLIDIIQIARSSARLTPGVAAKLYGVANFFEQGVYGRIACGGLAAIKQRQYESTAMLTPDIFSCFCIIEAVIRSRPERAFPVLSRPHPIDSVWPRMPPLNLLVQGQEAFS